MADVTITTDDEPGGEQAGVAAGMAIATAAQAAEDAEVAVAEAEQATETAIVAIENGDRAAEAAYNAQDDVAALRAEFTAFADELRGALAERQAPEVVEVTEPAPEPAPAGQTSAEGGEQATKGKKAKQDKGSDNDDEKPGYGSKLYWGRR